MKTAFTSQQLALLDAPNQRVEFYAAIHRPRIIAWCQLNGVPNNYPGSQISVDNVVAFYNLSAIKAGMTLRLGSESNKDDLGTIRVREDYASGSVIKLAEFGSGLINWRDNACVTVIEEYRAWPIHHSYDTALSTWLVDTKNYTSQLSQYGPQVIMGPPAVATLDDGKAVVNHAGNLSYSHTPGASIASQTWTFPNGATVTSALGSSAAPVTQTYINASPNGAYHTLAVTDSNGASHIGQRLVFVFGSHVDQKPPRVSFEAITGGLKSGGYRTRILMHDNAPSSVLVDGAQVVIFERASYGTVASSVGGNYYDRENIVMVGRILNDSMRIEPFTQELSFTLETIDSELRKANGYDLFLEGNTASTTASSWDMASNLTIDHTALALVKYRSTIANVTDFHPASGAAATNEIYYRSLPAGFLWDQLTYNYEAVFGIVAADLQGTIWAGLDAQVTGLSANLPTIIDLKKSRRLNTTTIEHEHVDTNAQYRLYAVQGGVASPLGAESPGQRQGYYGGKQEVSRNLLVSDQDTLVTWSGNVRARENNPYKRVVQSLTGNIRLDSVPQSLVTMSLSATENRRNISWENQKFIVDETTINYNPNMYANSEVVMQSVVNGIGGSAITFPNPGNNGGGGGGGGGGTPGELPSIHYIKTLTRLARTRNYNTSTPDFQSIKGNIGETGTVFDFVLDPYHPSTVAWCTTLDGIYRTTNLNNNIPTWTMVQTKAQIQSATGTASFSVFQLHSIKGTIAAEGTFFVRLFVQHISSGGKLYVGHTHDNGATWDWTNADATGGSTHVQGNAFEVGQHNANIVAIGYRIGTGHRPIARISTDGGHSFSDYYTSVSDDTGVHSILIPLNDNPTDQVGYILLDGEDTDSSVSTTDPKVLMTTNQGGSWSDITPSGFSFGSGTIHAQRKIGDYTPDRSKIYVSNGYSLYYSENYGTTFTVRSTFTGSQGFGGFPYNSGLLYRMRCAFLNTPSSGALYVSTDGGFTWADKTGNWGVQMNDFDAFSSFILVTPDWTSL